MEQLEFGFYEIPGLDNVKKAISFLEEVKSDLDSGREFTPDELRKIHNLAVKIEQHGFEMKMVAAWNLGRLGNINDPTGGDDQPSHIKGRRWITGLMT